MKSSRKIGGLPPWLNAWKSPLRRWARTAIDTFDATLFPTPCPICDADTFGPPICPDCRKELLESGGKTCSRCAMPVGPFANVDRGCSECRGRALGFDAAVALGPYQGPIRALCLRLKDEQGAWVARWLCQILVEARGDVLRQEIQKTNGTKSLSSNELRHIRPVIAAIPQHWSRGVTKLFYNHSYILAEELERILRVPFRKVLHRVRSTQKLAGLSRTERSRQLRSAFSVRGQGVKGRLVLLVDDILTSGATCGAAARALKQAGAKRVVVVVIGRAEGTV